ncbi:hypothetical protein O181_040995 [Austropuccinia psidii MF-1]|uniref:Lipoprotein n=1 Tax=Austropuccinia psidii MF-1 TaxID=1389203 RepID=A0A9Q3HGQ7_9BASI|nr:hypothetical protein [Austropuccinia psidii MF-1]
MHKLLFTIFQVILFCCGCCWATVAETVDDLKTANFKVESSTAFKSGQILEPRQKLLVKHQLDGIYVQNSENEGVWVVVSGIKPKENPSVDRLIPMFAVPGSEIGYIPPMLMKFTRISDFYSNMEHRINIVQVPKKPSVSLPDATKTELQITGKDTWSDIAL